jgi:Acetyltransferases
VTTRTTSVSTPDHDDAPALTQVARMLGDSLPAACRGLAAYDAARFDAYLAAALTAPPAGRTLLLRTVRQAGEVIATADWRCPGSVLFLNGIYVRSAWRGQGVGRMLMADGVRLAEATGAEAVELHVSDDNPTAAALYRKLGFEPLGSLVWEAIPIEPDAGPEPDSGPEPDPGPEPTVRVLDWPAFTAHHAMYGFGDLTVAHGRSTTRVRLVGRALCVGATTGPDPVPVQTLVRLLAAERAYRITDRAVGSASTFASFVHMRASLAELSRNLGAV